MKEKYGLSVVTSGYAASGITGMLAAKHEAALLKRYRKGFVKSAKQVASQDKKIKKAFEEFAREEDRIFFANGRGIYDTLWAIGEAFESGLIIDSLKIPIRTETVEVCELLDLDPFNVPSDGIAFIVTDAPVRIADQLNKQGCPSEIIGRLSKDRARIFMIGERKRFLTKPAGGREGASADENR